MGATQPTGGVTTDFAYGRRFKKRRGDSPVPQQTRQDNARNSGEAKTPSGWEIKTVGEIANGFLGGGTPTTKRPEYWAGDIPWITSKGLGDKIELKTGEKFISEEALINSSTNVVPKDSIIFATRVGVGKVGINRLDLAINQDLAGVLIDKETYDIEFLAYQLGIDSVQQYVAMNKRGATIKGITRNCLKQIPLALPPFPEQKRIAHILSTVQWAIEVQERIIQITTELNKALMHKLFTEGLYIEPLKQTEMGPMPESWEVVNLGSLGKIGNGSTPKKSVPAYWTDGTYPWLTSSKVYDREIVRADQFVTNRALSVCHLPRVQPGAVLIAITGQGKTLGHCAVLRIEATLNQHLAYIALDQSKANSFFVRGYIETQYQNLRQVGAGGGSTKGALTCGFLRNLLIPIPPVSEQGEIVSIIDAIDRKIDLHRRKRAVLEELFKALLHKLMTGEVRVGKLDLSATESEVSSDSSSRGRGHKCLGDKV